MTDTLPESQTPGLESNPSPAFSYCRWNKRIMPIQRQRARIQTTLFFMMLLLGGAKPINDPALIVVLDMLHPIFGQSQ
jgi:hypothetical protein